MFTQEAIQTNNSLKLEASRQWRVYPNMLKITQIHTIDTICVVVTSLKGEGPHTFRNGFWWAEILEFWLETCA